WCDTLGVKSWKIANYHPQSNPCERTNRTVKERIIAQIDLCYDWANKLEEVAFAINTSVNDATGFSPVYLNYGRELSPPFDISLQLNNSQVDRDELSDRLQFILNLAKEKTIDSQQKYMYYYNKDKVAAKFKEGDQNNTIHVSTVSVVTKVVAVLFWGLYFKLLWFNMEQSDRKIDISLLKTTAAKQQIKDDTIRIARQMKLSNNNFGLGRKSKPPSRRLREKARSAAFYANMHRVLRPSIARQMCFHQIRQPTPVSGNSENDENCREGREVKSSIETTTEVDCASNPSFAFQYYYLYCYCKFIEFLLEKIYHQLG
ncbi:unnamed protein product, partial [Allacma fusca]